MNAAFLSLGGNIGNRTQHLADAMDAIVQLCSRITKTSSVYETEAWGMENAQNYLNQVIKIETELQPHALINTLLDIEKKAGRVREGHQYSDRVIDLDILFFNADVIHDHTLQIPHPRLHLRKFVLVPLAEIAPELMHPELHTSISELLKLCPDTLSVKKYFSPV